MRAAIFKLIVFIFIIVCSFFVLLTLQRYVLLQNLTIIWDILLVFVTIDMIFSLFPTSYSTKYVSLPAEVLKRI